MTTGGLPFERLFSMPALEGVRSLRAHLLANPGMEVAEAITIVKGIELDIEGLDLEASQAILAIIDHTVPNDGTLFYRGCIRQILLAYQPVWARTMLQGRSRFYSALERDEQSLFRQTGILDDPPDDHFVEWWDGLTGELRLVVDLGKLVRGRAAEKLTLEYESQRLAEQGINDVPRWIGLDDNTKGYDVLSFEMVSDSVRNKLIEVKSTIASPLRYFVTRNEWEQAERSGSAYVFHIWDMQKDPPILHVRTVEQVRPHIPFDNEKGKWKGVEVPVGAG